MTTNGQTAAGMTVPGTQLAREATELIRESASNLIYLHSRRDDWRECPDRDGSVPRAHLLGAAAALLIAVIADDAPGDPDAAALAPMHDLAIAGPDRILLPALIRVALGLFERRARHGPAEAPLFSELTGLPGEMKRSAPPSAEPHWPGEPITNSETRVLRYLPTHLAAPEIAAELCLSVNTVRSHLRGLYQKLGAHSRQEAVQRARAVGLLKDHPASPRNPVDRRRRLSLARQLLPGQHRHLRRVRDVGAAAGAHCDRLRLGAVCPDQPGPERAQERGVQHPHLAIGGRVHQRQPLQQGRAGLPFVGDQRELVVLHLTAVVVDLFDELLVGGLGPGRPRPVQQPRGGQMGWM